MKKAPAEPQGAPRKPQSTRRVGWWVALAALIVVGVALLSYNDVSTDVTPDDAVYAARMLRETGHADLVGQVRPADFDDQVATILAVQGAVLSIAPDNQGIPIRSAPRAPRSLSGAVRPLFRSEPRDRENSQQSGLRGAARRCVFHERCQPTPRLPHAEDSVSRAHRGEDGPRLARDRLKQALDRPNKGRHAGRSGCASGDKGSAGLGLPFEGTHEPDLKRTLQLSFRPLFTSRAVLCTLHAHPRRRLAPGSLQCHRLIGSVGRLWLLLFLLLVLLRSALLEAHVTSPAAIHLRGDDLNGFGVGIETRCRRLLANDNPVVADRSRPDARRVLDENGLVVSVEQVVADLHIRHSALITLDHDAVARVADKLRSFDADVGNSLASLVRLHIDAGAWPRSTRVAEHGICHEQSVRADDREPLPAIVNRRNGAKGYIGAVRNIEAISPHAR